MISLRTFRGSIILYIVFLLWIMSNIPIEALIFPDGRVIHISDQDDFTYYLQESKQLNKTVRREYALFELHPNTALLCPKAYFIGEITQELIVNLNISHPMPENIKHSASYKDQAVDFKVAPCPTLYNCLGFQACLFKFGNEFCKRDAAPDFRKMLLVSIHCIKDRIWKFFGNDLRRKDQVLHIRYRSRLEEKAFKEERDYYNTVLVEDRVPENVVFGAECPSLKAATIQEGYSGQCHTLPIHARNLTQSIWKLLGRARSSRCRSELLQIFCAYQYNPQGLCVPPVFLEKDKDMFNFQSMPNFVNENTEKYINASSNKLSPVRLGFILLLHKTTPAAIQLLKSIWKPYHYFVIHIDKRSSAIRTDLHSWLSKETFYSKNVLILPENRSFATSWGSYQIVRAQLEGIAELLKMGAWDFVVNLSGADLPLRDVDDFSAALSPYRGLNFLPFAHWKNNPKEVNDSGNLIHEAFHSCDDYVFKVSNTAGMPNPEELKLYNAPQWGVFSREFAKYLVDQRQRSEHINKYQFYLQTHIIPDESYIITVLMNSPFRDTFRQYAVHASKEFSSNNADHLCRHTTDADFCGQGPAIYQEEDKSELMSLSHRSFFARKFSSDVNDPTRTFALGLSHQGYQQFIETFLPQEILWDLAESTLSYLTSAVDDLSNHSLILENVSDIRILPSLTPHDPCCASPLLSGLRRMTDHELWMDIVFKDENTNVNSMTCRLSFEPVINGRFCYLDGDLRMIFVSPWTKHFKEENEEGNKELEKIALIETMPFPYGPAQIYSITIALVFARDDNENFTCLDETYETTPIVINTTTSEVTILLGLFSPDGRMLCTKKETITIAPSENSDEANFTSTLTDNGRELFYVHTISLNCGLMEAGAWTLQLTDAMITPKSRVYKIPFYLLDFDDKEKLKPQLSDLQYLWNIKHYAINSTQKKFLNNTEKKKPTFELPITINKRKPERRIPAFINVFVCYGGLLLCVIICFTLHLWFSRRSVTVMYRRVLLNYLFAVSMATVLQAMLLLWCC